MSVIQDVRNKQCYPDVCSVLRSSSGEYSSKCKLAKVSWLIVSSIQIVRQFSFGIRRRGHKDFQEPTATWGDLVNQTDLGSLLDVTGHLSLLSLKTFKENSQPYCWRLLGLRVFTSLRTKLEVKGWNSSSTSCGCSFSLWHPFSCMTILMQGSNQSQNLLGVPLTKYS